jgi:hypothetical protein
MRLRILISPSHLVLLIQPEPPSQSTKPSHARDRLCRSDRFSLQAASTTNHLMTRNTRTLD